VVEAQRRGRLVGVDKSEEGGRKGGREGGRGGE